MKDFLAYLDSPAFLAALTADRFFLILAVIVLSSLKHSAYKSMWLAMLINLPGTVLHEMRAFYCRLAAKRPSGNFFAFS